MSADGLANLSAGRIDALVRGLEADLADTRNRNEDLERQVENLERALEAYKERARRWKLEAQRSRKRH
jgi:cell division protein FtsB